MAQKNQVASKKENSSEIGSRRTFPHHTLEESLPLAQKIADEMGGRPMNRLLLAEAVGIKPGSSNFRLLLSSAYKYHLTDGTEKSEEIGLTEDGIAATQRVDAAKRTQALRRAALRAQPIGRFIEDYKNKKLPSEEMLPKILKAQYDVPSDLASECANLIIKNARFVGMLRDISGSPHILLEGGTNTIPSPTSEEKCSDDVSETPSVVSEEVLESLAVNNTASPNQQAPSQSKPIFVGHGKNTIPLQKLEGLLSTFQIPFKVTVKEANLGRPIPQKVKETMLQCGSAILIFTKDEKFFGPNGEEFWRPSENVVHELGASSFAYGDRIVIFKERGLHFPSNFQSIGYIEFDVDSLEAKTTDLLKELIGFGLVKIMPM